MSDIKEENKTKVNKTDIVAGYLIDLIQSGKVPVNKIMPSEHQLMYRFGCSRSVVIAAYSKLQTLGAVYSISKRGYFVAENFHNLVKPLSYLIGSDKCKGKEVVEGKKLPEWIFDKRIIFVEDFREFDKKYFKNNNLIGVSKYYISTKNLKENEVIDLENSLIDLLIDRNAISNIIYDLKYEDDPYFGFKKIVVVYFFGYDDDSISLSGKFWIHPDHFKFNHQEFSLKKIVK
ncbi:winged helix-turn-helix domain-containing protein [Mycoplasmopsis gallinacea]|uniref:GntR family transcriptional regulator n=1 Tax=Mycoplasmopsis gallinacea TaxID=29556 RepID=A0A449A369_9BACT|nr:winged helix-turn-helix domain-containing protein [Mycoplasmopsis gallinacea]VEU58662.1 GntR family transcriptional regulator [Mycoplasmopsis gallinacea]